jgi:hypothetical protein
MNTKPILKLLLLLLCFDAYSQNNNKPILVKAGTTIKESVQVTDLYEYPRFMRGAVFFKDGKTSHGDMNYNRFLDEMQFIAGNGDTLSLINEKNIDFISIGKDTFVYDNAYIKLQSDSADVKFGTREMLRIIDRKKLSAYGTTSSIETIDNYSSYMDGRKEFTLVVMQDVYLGKRIQYFIGNKYKHFVLATKKNTANLFPKQESAVLRFINENHVDFNKKESLEMLVQFLRLM